MKNLKLITGIMLMFSLIAGNSLAETNLNGTPIIQPGTNLGLPSHYPTYTLPSGKITNVLKQKRVIVLDGMAFKLHPVHDIYTSKKGQQATLYNLKRGMKVGLEFTTYQGNKVVNKVWILPKNYPSTNIAH